MTLSGMVRKDLEEEGSSEFSSEGWLAFLWEEMHGAGEDHVSDWDTTRERLGRNP